MAKQKKHTVPIEGRIRSGLTSAAPTTWGESVRPEGKLIVFEMWCKRCGICVEFCPTGALTEREDGLPLLVDQDKCTLCGMCWLRCPDMAIIKGPELLGNRSAEEEAERARRLLCEIGVESACTIETENAVAQKNTKDEANNG